MVELPKLLRMSLRTTPLSVSMFETDPLTVFEPSPGYGPAVSSAFAVHVSVPELLLELLEELLLEELLLEELLLELELPLLEPPPPPQAATSAAALPESIQPRIRRRSLSAAIFSRSC